MLRPPGQGHVPLIGSARQSPDFIEKRGSFCPSTSSSVSLESGAAILQACYLWHTHSFAAVTGSEAGWRISALLSPFYNTLQRLRKAAPRKAGQHSRLICCWVREEHFVYTTKSWKALENTNALNLAEESTQAPSIKTNANNLGSISD